MKCRGFLADEGQAREVSPNFCATSLQYERKRSYLLINYANSTDLRFEQRRNAWFFSLYVRARLHEKMTLKAISEGAVDLGGVLSWRSQGPGSPSRKKHQDTQGTTTVRSAGLVDGLCYFTMQPQWRVFMKFTQQRFSNRGKHSSAPMSCPEACQYLAQPVCSQGQKLKGCSSALRRAVEIALLP